MAQAQTYPLGDILWSFNVVTLDVDNSNRCIETAVCYLAYDFDFCELTARHLEMDLIDWQIEERGKQWRVPSRTHGAALVVAKTKMCGKPAASHNRLYRLGENFNKAMRLFAMRIAAHGRLIQRDLPASSLYQSLELCANDRNQSLGNVPAALVYSSRIDSS